MRQVNKRAAL